jgi:hypothetical protein
MKYQIQAKSLLNEVMTKQRLRNFEKKKDYESLKNYIDELHDKINFSIENKLYDENSLKRDLKILTKTIEDFSYMV